MARQRLGQHFLADAGWREKIARAIRVSPHGMESTGRSAEEGYCWIEIGAGHGEMTAHLLRSGAPVIVVELDPPLVERLQKLAQSHSNLTVIHGDVLKTDLAALAAGRRMKIYGNLPYYITSPILHHFFEYAPQIDEAHIVIQLEVAQRLTAKPGSKLYGYLSVATQFYSRPDFALRLPRGAFRPPPEVGSALVTLRFPGAAGQPGIENAQAFMEFVKMCFGQKRKTLSNNLRGIAEPGRVREILRELKLREDARAEQLTVGQLAELYGQVEYNNKEDHRKKRGSEDPPLPRRNAIETNSSAAFLLTWRTASGEAMAGKRGLALALQNRYFLRTARRRSG